MAIELLIDIESFQAVQAEWEELHANCRHRNPFLTFQWLDAWLTVFGDEVEPYVILSRDGSTLCGAAPLVMDKSERLIFIGYPQTDYVDFLIKTDSSEALGEILDFLLQKNRTWHKMILDQFSQNRSNIKAITNYLDIRRVPYRLLPSDDCPAMVLDDKEAARKKYYKRNITTYVNWYNKQGELKYNIYTDTDEAVKHLEFLFDQHIGRRDQTPFPSQFNDVRIKELFRQFMIRMHPKGWVLFSSLTLDNEFLALYLSFEYEKVLYLYTTSFNDAYRKRSPGQVILRHQFDYAIERSILEMDFARGGEEYKDRFANTLRQNLRLIVYSNQFNRIIADLWHAIRFSKLADLLLRNRRSQNAKMTFLYARRKQGMVTAIIKGLMVIFHPARKGK